MKKTIAIILSLALLMSVCMQSLFIQRINATKSAGDAKKATLFNAVMCGVFMVFGVGVIGITASVTTPADVSGNNVITAILSGMPTILGALYASSIIAAVLASCCPADKTTINVVPYPNSVEMKCGSFAAAG